MNARSSITARAYQKAAIASDGKQNAVLSDSVDSHIVVARPLDVNQIDFSKQSEIPVAREIPAARDISKAPVAGSIQLVDNHAPVKDVSIAPTLENQLKSVKTVQDVEGFISGQSIAQNKDELTSSVLLSKDPKSKDYEPEFIEFKQSIGVIKQLASQDLPVVAANADVLATIVSGVSTLADSYKLAMQVYENAARNGVKSGPKIDAPLTESLQDVSVKMKTAQRDLGYKVFLRR